MSDALGEIGARVPALAAQHLLLAMSALALAVAMAVPLGVLSARRPRIRRRLAPSRQRDSPVRSRCPSAHGSHRAFTLTLSWR